MEESNFVGVNWFFNLIYVNDGENTKRVKAKRYYLPKRIIKN